MMKNFTYKRTIPLRVGHNNLLLKLFTILVLLVANIGTKVSAQEQTARLHIEKIPIRKVVGHLWAGKDKTGVKIKSSYTGTGSVAVEVRATNPIIDTYYCNFPIVGFVPVLGPFTGGFGDSEFAPGSKIPKRMLLYKTTVNGNKKGEIDKGTGDPMEIHGGETGVAVYNSESFTSCRQEWNWNPAGSSIKTNSPMFYRRNMQTWELITNVSGATEYFLGASWHRMWRGDFPVDVTLRFTGDMTLDDIEEIHIPGKTIRPEDFQSQNGHPVSYAENSVIHINSVEFSLQKDIQPFSTVRASYDGTFQDVWLSGKPIPTFEEVSQKPYRVPIKKVVSGNNGGYGNFTAEGQEIPIYLKNPTTDDNLNLHLSIDVDNASVTAHYSYTYAVWLNYDNTTNNGQHTYDEVVSGATVSYEEEVASGFKDDGSPIEVSIPLPYNNEIISNYEEFTRRLRVSIRRTDNSNNIPQPAMIIDNGEVEDYNITFKPSVFNRSGQIKDIPYDYLVYAEKELPYENYQLVRSAKDHSYQKETNSDLLDQGRHFKVDVAVGIPYALSKHTKNAYDNHVRGVLDNITYATPKYNIRFDELDTEGFRDEKGDYQTNNKKPSGQQAFRKLDPLNYPYYKDVTFLMFKEDLIDPGNMQDLLLYADVYYPVPKTGRSMTDLTALPIALWMPGGGFMWNQGRGYAKTDRPARWLASQGFIVVTPDYRQGINAYDPNLARRAMVKAWMDMNTAVKWWKSSGYDKAYSNGLEVTKDDTDANGDRNLPLWKADLTNVIGTGSSAGAVTALHNAYLTQDIFDLEANPSGQLKGITNGYPVNKVTNFGFSNAGVTVSPGSYYAHDIRNYESIPCLDYIVNGVKHNTCDGFMNNKNKVINTGTQTSVQERQGFLPDWAFYNQYVTNYYQFGSLTPYLQPYSSNLPVDPIPSEMRSVLNTFHQKSPRCDKILSFAGAIEQLDWVKRATNVPPVAELHHREDSAVAADSYYGFSEISTDYWQNLGVIGFYIYRRFNYHHGGIAINRELDHGEATTGVNDHNDDNFRLLLQTGPEMGGGGPGDVWQHQTQFKFGTASYAEYGANLNAYLGRYGSDKPSSESTDIHQLEPKTMYFASAFLAKNYGTGTHAYRNTAKQTEKKEETEKPKEIIAVKEEKLESALGIYPNPTSNHLSIHYEIKNSGDVRVQLFNVLGKLVYSKTTKQTAGIQNESLQLRSLGLQSGMYILKITTPSFTKTKKILFAKE